MIAIGGYTKRAKDVRETTAEAEKLKIRKSMKKQANRHFIVVGVMSSHTIYEVQLLVSTLLSIQKLSDTYTSLTIDSETCPIIKWRSSSDIAWQQARVLTVQCV